MSFGHHDAQHALSLELYTPSETNYCSSVSLQIPPRLSHCNCNKYKSEVYGIIFQDLQDHLPLNNEQKLFCCLTVHQEIDFLNHIN